MSPPYCGCHHSILYKRYNIFLVMKTNFWVTQTKVKGTKVMSICSLSSGLCQIHSLPSGNYFATIISKLNELLFGAGEVDLGESVGGGVKS